ncbi:AAA family ATPase [Priestia aryabhattai]
MAKGSYLKQLFQSFSDGDTDSFTRTAHSIIEEEKRKNHYQLADDLQKIINSISSKQFRKAESNFQNNYLHLLPKDKDSNFSLVDIKSSDVLLEDLVLQEDIEENISELIKEYETSEILAAYGLKPRNKYLFCGPPGCGKTLTAKAIAGELDLPILYTRFDSIVSSYLGETASNLRKIFDFVTQGNWILFFDEFDAISKQRDSNDEHGELKRVVNSFLQLLDNYEGNSIIIAATNHQNILDSAIWRRFDDVILFEKPSLNEIYNLLKKNLKRYPIKDIDLEIISEKLEGFSHSDIERVCLNAIRKAIIESKTVLNQDDLLLQVNLYQKRNNIYTI